MLTRLARCRPATLAAAAMLALSACASTQGAGGQRLTPAQRELREQNQRFNETIATGAVVGALVLGILGAVVAGRDNRAAGAAVGAATGAAVGAAAGHYLAKRNQRYASREQAAMARTEAAQREAADLAATARASEQVAAENRAKLARLEAQLRAGQATAAQLEAQRRTAQQDLDLMDSAIDHSRKVESAMRADGVPDQAASVAQSRRRMEDSARQLREALAKSPSA